MNFCAQIYEKHQKALDLIFENKPDKASELTDIIVEWASQKEGIELNSEKSSKSYTRFTTKEMSEILPNAEGHRSGWGTDCNTQTRFYQSCCTLKNCAMSSFSKMEYGYL